MSFNGWAGDTIGGIAYCNDFSLIFKTLFGI